MWWRPDPCSSPKLRQPIAFTPSREGLFPRTRCPLTPSCHMSDHSQKAQQLARGAETVEGALGS